MKGSLDIELTRRCNLRCSYCFVGWSRGWFDEMPLDIALQIVDEGAGHFPILHLTGGEPLVYRGLFQIIEAGLEHAYDEILINTNGSLITDEIADRFASYGPRVALSVSLDGPSNTHDRMRGQGSFALALQGLDRLLDRGVRVTVMTVVTSEALDTLASFLLDLRRTRKVIAGFTLFPVGVGENASGTSKPGEVLESLTPDELRRLVVSVALLQRAGYPIGIGAYPIVNPLLLSLGYPASMLYQCTAGRGRLCVHANLSVSTCHPVKEAVYGIWRSGLLDEIASFEAHKRMARRDFDGCSSCSHVEQCGHCRAYVVASGEDLFGNDAVCENVVPGRAEEMRSAGYASRDIRSRRVALPLFKG